jgi:hypothetical protein
LVAAAEELAGSMSTVVVDQIKADALAGADAVWSQRVLDAKAASDAAFLASLLSHGPVTVSKAVEAAKAVGMREKAFIEAAWSLRVVKPPGPDLLALPPEYHRWLTAKPPSLPHKKKPAKRFPKRAGRLPKEI